jgi:cytosine/adenosine deaminase-related metal-dependent hydrolase
MSEARGNYLFKNGAVITVDRKIGTLPKADVLVKNGVIEAVGENLDGAGAEVIDASNMIIMPGMIDSHYHMWSTLGRNYISDGGYEYFQAKWATAELYSADDFYNSVSLGLADLANMGVTTVHNWAHNVRSPDHADAELSAMRDTGIRGRFAYGPAQGMPDDKTMDLEGLARVKRDWMPGDGMLTLGISSRNIGAMSVGGATRGTLSIEMTKKDWGGARALGLPITVHTSGPSPIKQLDEAGLLGPDVQLVHPLLTTPEERAILKARGVSYSTSPTGEARRPSKLGVIQLGELLQDGVKVSLSTDHTTNYNCDPFVAMRILFVLHQHRIGNMPLTLKRLVQLATLDGAVDLGIADKTGSLTPGKRADIILVRTTDINMAPVGDPYEALVSRAQPTNIETVVVDGRILRQSNKFTALDHPKVLREAREAADALRAKAKWPA